jgi:Putative homoserine kinase type II (protein kinase fold)
MVLNKNLSFNVTKAKKLMEGYNEIRKISKDEKIALKVLSQGAALRFLLTRVFDYLNAVDDAFVKIKDPEEYLRRLEFHKNAKSYEDYLI